MLAIAGIGTVHSFVMGGFSAEFSTELALLGGVVEGGCVAFECVETGGRVSCARSVASERKSTSGRVVEAGGVAFEPILLRDVELL